MKISPILILWILIAINIVVAFLMYRNRKKNLKQKEEKKNKISEEDNIPGTALVGENKKGVSNKRILPKTTAEEVVRRICLRENYLFRHWVEGKELPKKVKFFSSDGNIRTGTVLFFREKDRKFAIRRGRKGPVIYRKPVWETSI